MPIHGEVSMIVRELWYQVIKEKRKSMIVVIADLSILFMFYNNINDEIKLKENGWYFDFIYFNNFNDWFKGRHKTIKSTIISIIAPFTQILRQ